MTTKKLDVVTLEVLRNVLPAITNEMSYVLQRTSYNMMIYDVRDYCCALLDTEGRLLAQNTGGVSHFVTDMGTLIKDAVTRFGKESFRRGDVVVTNHQRVAGQHLNNMMVYTPYFAEGELAGFAAVRAHWVDVGGVSTGFGAGGLAADPWMEGLQLDQVKLYEQGKLDEKVWSIIRDNIRFPQSSMGDLKSQIAACHLGEKRIEEIYDRYSRAIVEQGVERIFDQTEARCRAVVSGFRDGVYYSESLFRGLPADNNEPLQIKVKVTIQGGDMEVDLTQCSRERRAAMNSRTLSAPVIAYKAITLPTDPVNEGAFRGLKIKIQEGNYMMARYPAPMASWSSSLPTVVDTILHALAPALSDKIPAGHLGVLGGTVVFFGANPGTGQRFVTQSIEGGGWGARPWEDGECAAVSVCQGDVRNAPIEKMELRWPVRVLRRELRRDSGGAGKFRGGLGLDTEVMGLVEGSWNVFDSGRDNYPPQGLNGGLQGEPSAHFLRLPGEAEFRYVKLTRHAVPEGAQAIVATAGGGGWGNPLGRDPEKVRWDVIEGYVSIEAAQKNYGVVLEQKTLAINREATERLRAQMAASAQGPDHSPQHYKEN